MKVEITKEFGHFKLSENLKCLLQCCIAKEGSRYAIDGVQVDEEGFAATNGRLLIRVEHSHKIPVGIYHLTTDGYLLFNKGVECFPKWQDIIPKPETVNETDPIELSDSLESNVLYKINKVGILADIDLLLPVLKALNKVQADHIIVASDKQRPEIQPIMLTGTIERGSFTFLQMPLSQ